MDIIKPAPTRTRQVHETYW